MTIDIERASKNILLSGATSQIGVFAIPRLIAAGFRVFALSRKDKPAYYPDTHGLTWVKPGDLGELTDSYSCFISAGPLGLALELLSQENKVETAVVFSSSSVEVKLKSSNVQEKCLMQDMLELEKSLQILAQAKNLSLVIFRPTLVYGCGLDSNISRLASWIRRFGFLPVNGKASGLRQPVHADDLASAAVSALLSKKELPGMMYLTGGSTLSYAEMVSRVFTAMGKPEKLLRLPQWLFLALVYLLGMVRPDSGINTEMVRRQRLDLVFKDQVTNDLLDYRPRPFAPTKEDFCLPAARSGTLL